MADNREKALKWFNNLSFTGKWELVVKYKKLVVGYPDRDPNTLTGSEIEILYNEYLKS